MAEKKYASLSTLQTFLDNLKNKFAAKSHKHTMSDISDYTVDSALSSTSTNPVQNKVLDAEFDAISNAMGALESAIDGKADSTHTHEASAISYGSNGDTLDAVIDGLDSRIGGKAPFDHTHNIADMDDYDSVIGGIYGDIGGLWSTFDSKADVNHTHTTSEIIDINDLELITTTDIDNICGTNVLVQSAEEVSF